MCSMWREIILHSRSAIYDQSCFVHCAGLASLLNAFYALTLVAMLLRKPFKALYIKYSKANLNKQLYNSGSSVVLKVF